MAQQEPLEGLQATRVKFVGMAADSLDRLPELDDVITFSVTARCTARGSERMKDGERRATARMEIISLEPLGPPERAERTPALFSVHDDDEDD